MTARRIGAVLGALMLAAAPGSARAETAQPDGWRFAVTPYIWLAGVAGEATPPQRSRDCDADFGDVLSNLDLAAMAMFEACQGRFRLVVDGLYLGQWRCARRSGCPIACRSSPMATSAASTGSRLTWQVLGAVSLQATQGTSLQLGYRHLAVDVSRGDLALDLSFGGPILGETIRF